MILDVSRFARVCNPSRTLIVGNTDDQPYYIDFAAVRGKIIETLERTITRLSPDEPTCQLFTGHIGCGKSTELYRLKAELEAQGFYVVYFEADQDLDVGDVDVTDILLAIARQISQRLEAIQIRLRPGYFTNLFREIVSLLQTPIEISEVGFSAGVATLTAKTKDSPGLRSQLRQYLEPRTNSILEAINHELLDPAIAALKQQGKRGLVVIADNLDRIDNAEKPSGRVQSEYLFVDRGEQLRRLKCHVVYTIPLSLIFSNDLVRLANRFGVRPKVLPMVPMQTRDGLDYAPGMALMRQMVLARAFPDISANDRIALISEVFDQRETLDRLCQISGGHPRNLLRLLYSGLQREDPPLSRAILEEAIREECDDLTGAISDDEWDLLFRALAQQNIQGDEDYQVLLRSLFLFEYRAPAGRWFGINPVLAEAEKYKLWVKRGKANG
jgi:hypothetical protein